MTTRAPPIDLDGLPPGVIAQLSRGGRCASNPALCRSALASLDRAASLDEIIVTIWRKHGRLVTRAELASALSLLQRQGKVTRVGKGIWKLT